MDEIFHLLKLPSIQTYRCIMHKYLFPISEFITFKGCFQMMTTYFNQNLFLGKISFMAIKTAQF